MTVDYQRILILETSGRPPAIALARGDQIVAQGKLDDARRRASDLTSVVQQLLQQQEWAAQDIDAAIVGLGPGSYTGLRVALASAKALCYATGSAFFGIESFASCLIHVPPDYTQATIVADALQGRCFVRYCHRQDGDWQPQGEIQTRLISEMTASPNPESFLTGPAAHLIGGQSQNPDVPGLLWAHRHCPWAIQTDIWQAEPLYIRGSSAEEKKRQLQ